MKKFVLLLIVLFPLLSEAQNDLLINSIMERLYSELVSEQLFSRSSWMYGECSSDNSEVGGENINDFIAMQQRMLFQSKPCDGTNNDFWTRAYDIIFLSNKVIADIKNTAFTANEKTQIVAEAKFIRSLIYFELVKNFGGVPLYTDTTGWKFQDNFGLLDPNEDICYQTDWKKGRSSIAGVFSLIKADLAGIISDLPEKTELTIDTKYKVTNNAARALLAKVYLYQSSYAKNYPSDIRFSGLIEQWSAALSYAEDIINSGQYKLTGIEGENYSTFWDNSYLYPSQSSGFRYIFSVPGNYCSESVFEAEGNQTTYTTWADNVQTVYTTCRYYKKLNLSSGSTGGWGFNIPTQDLINEFARESGNKLDDPRYIATIASAGDSILFQYKWYLMDYHNIPYNAACRKFECSYDEFWRANTLFNGTMNIRIIRYADVVLMAAEAALMLGNNTKALQYINLVRTRARMCGSTGYPKDLTSVSMEDIMHERRLELALEGHRFYDLVRWNLAETKLNGRFNASFQQNIVFTKGKDEFLPIPDAVVRSSEGIVGQNHGYDQVCPFITGVGDMYINSTQTQSILNLDYSGNTLSDPAAKVYSSNPSKAIVSLEGKKLRITYFNLTNGDSIKVTFSVFSSTPNDSIFTIFKIKVLDPSLIVNEEDINIVHPSPYSFLFEMKNDLTSIIPALSYNCSIYSENGNKTPGFSASYLNVSKLGRRILVMFISPNTLLPQYLDGTLPAKFNTLVVLKNNTQPDIAVRIPVDIFKLFPVISLQNKNVVKDEEFTISVSTSYIDTAAFSILYQTYAPKINGFTFYSSYNPEDFEFIKCDYQSTLFLDISNDSVLAKDGGLYVRCLNNQPILGEGKMVDLHFKALNTSTSNVRINDFYFEGLYNPFVIFDYQLLPLETPNINENKDIFVYPNPVNNQLKISSTINLSSYKIFDLNGRSILSGHLYGLNESINVTKFSPGIYFIRFEGKDTINTQKFIKH